MRKAIILMIIIYLLYTIVCLIVLGGHYVSVGECTAITYYHPLTWWDRVCFILLGTAPWIISLRLIPKDMKHRNSIKTIISLIYVLSVVLYMVYGNKMLATREMGWPHYYNAQPTTNIQSKIVKNSLNHAC